MSRAVAVALSVVVVLGAVPAASGMLGLAIGAHGGYGSYSAGGVSNGGLDLGVDANVSVPFIVSLQVFADYFTYSISSEGQDPVIETDVTDIPIGLHMMYEISLPGFPIKPYLGAGPSIHILTSKTSGLSGGDQEESSTKLGLGGVGGLEYKFMPKIGLFFELRDHIIFTENENTNALYVLGGARLHLP